MNESLALLSEGKLIYREAALKRAALLFDHLLIFEYGQHTEMPELLDSFQSERRTQDRVARLQTLRELGIVSDLYGYGYAFGKEAGEQFVAELTRAVIDHHFSRGDEVLPDHLPYHIRQEAFHRAHRDLMLREAAARLRNTFQTDPTVIDPSVPATTPAVTGPDSVLQVVLNAMPQPDETTAWEDIIEFRGDPQSRGALIRLKNWMRSIANPSKTVPEIRDALAETLFEYEEHMKLHHMKIERGVWETIIVTAAEVAEDLSNKRFGSLAKTAFSFKHRKIALLEAERAAPGRQAAYIMMARHRFGKN